ncbi:hypothetical protein OH799_05290 [Nocardia sp. NBC_00881]|nr:hypothetical protein OH799_05290 [Nocardia sp. NBC_00881]
MGAYRWGGGSVVEAAMGSWMEELERRQAAAQERAEELRGRIVELSEQLAAEEQRLSRLEITRETMIEILGAAGEAVVAVPQGGMGENDMEAEGVNREPVSRGSSPVGVMLVPQRGPGMDVSVLPQDYRDILEVLADAGRGLRAGHIAAALGLSVRSRRPRSWSRRGPGPRGEWRHRRRTHHR